MTNKLYIKEKNELNDELIYSLLKNMPEQFANGEIVEVLDTLSEVVEALNEFVWRNS